MEDVAAVLAERDGLVWANLQKEQKAVYTQLIQRSGYHIYTTLDMDVQNQVDAIYTNLEEIPETRGGQQLQSGIVVIDNRTGDIVAMAGGVGEKTVFDGYNLATDAKLQVGSSFKPIAVYAPAFELGAISPATVVKDLPLRYMKDSGKTTPFPRNAEKRYLYSRTVLNGIVESVNAVSVHTLDMIGTRYSYDFAKDQFHISGLVDSERYTDVDYAPLGLGGLTYGATVRDMACAYATFANKGVYRHGRTFTKVYDSQGNLVIDNEQKSEEILSKKTVDYINYCLDQAVDHGTGDMADIKGMDVCGKTGTTNSKKDRYFCGYTGHYTAAVWCGFKIPAEIQLTGSDTRHPAARLWRKVMAPLHKGKETIPLYNKSKMKKVTVCLDSGMLATDACKADVRGDHRTETVLAYKEDFPDEECKLHTVVEYCKEGAATANDYCKKFAKAGAIEVTESALVKLTQSQVDEIKKASKYGLKDEYVSDSYIYLITSKGKDAEFKGINGDLDGSAPYATCKVHTKEAWEAYLKDNPDADKPDEEDPDKEKPDGEKPDEEKPNGEKPKDEEKPKEEKPKEEKPKEEKPKDEKPKA
jgi:penicillin-binding protein 1A